MTLLFYILLFALLIIQAFIFYKISGIINNVNRMLLEVRNISLKMNTAGEPFKNKLITSNSCYYCRYRMSFIQINESEDNADNFYYKCKKHNLEISLTDSCKQFEEDYRQV